MEYSTLADGLCRSALTMLGVYRMVSRQPWFSAVGTRVVLDKDWIARHHSVTMAAHTTPFHEIIP
jgi:hypothetical protein